MDFATNPLTVQSQLASWPGTNSLKLMVICMLFLYYIRIDGIPSILTDLRKEFNPKNYILNFPANLVHASDILLLLSAFTYNDTHILVFSRLGLNNLYPKITFEYFLTSFIIVWIPTTL